MSDTQDILIFKKLNSTDVIFNSFKTNKEWLVDNSTSASFGVVVSSGSYNILMDKRPQIQHLIDEQYLTFKSINQLFYKQSSYPPVSVGTLDDIYQSRELHDEFTLISIPTKVFGERINPGSVELQTNSKIIRDDKQGNLYDYSLSSSFGISKAKLVPNSNLVGYWSFNDNYVDSGSYNLLHYNNMKIRDYSSKNNNGYAYNVEFDDGVYGKEIVLLGSGSYCRIPYSRNFSFKTNEDFSISFWVKAPPTQSQITSGSNIILSKRGLTSLQSSSYYGGIPYEIGLYNTGSDNGKLYFYRSDSVSNLIMKTTSSINDGVMRNICVVKTGSHYELYVNSVCEVSSSASVGGNVFNYSDLFVGTTGKLFNYFSGSVDELRIYNRGLVSGSGMTSEVRALYETPANKYRVGNVFYSEGLVCLTHSNIKYRTLDSTWTLYFQGHHTIHEREILCEAKENEFNYSFNPTLRESGEMEDDRLRSFTTSSDFVPYVTTIGLYDDEARLIAIAKLARPVKKLNHDLTFVIRLDM
jgi:hypothetical protein